MALSPRSSAILEEILTSPAPVHVRDIVQRYAISERTAKYDLQSIRRWLALRGVSLQSKPGVGMTVLADADERARLAAEVSGTAVHASQDVRSHVVALMLALSAEPVPIQRLADDLDVSRNTLVNDLRATENYLSTFGLEVERTRSGVTLSGTHSRRRSCIDHTVCSRLTDADLARVVRFLAKGQLDIAAVSPELRLLLSVSPEREACAATVAEIVGCIDGSLHINLSDTAIVRMLVRLLIILAVPDEEDPASAETPDGIMGDLYQHMSDGLLARTGRAPSHDDLEFVLLETALVASSQLAEKSVGLWPSQDVAPLCRELVQRVGTELGLDLSMDSTLQAGLLAHLADRLDKIHLHIAEPRSILNELTTKYPDVYAAVDLAVADLLGPLGIKFSTSDLAYLTIHFASACERALNRSSYRALVVCATGRGTSQLIRTVVSSRIPSVHVVRTCSTFAAAAAAADPDIDLVISTFPLSLDKPTAVIRPIPSERDLVTIEDTIKQVRPDATVRVLAPREREPLTGGFGSVVTTGLQLARALVEAAGRSFTPTTMDGFQLHCILLVERARQGQQFSDDQDDPRQLPVELAAVLDRFVPTVTPAEARAILTYFELDEDS